MKKDSLHQKKLVSALAITLLTIAFISTASAQQNENDLTVTVNISEKTIIDIQPKQFSWKSPAAGNPLNPGSVAGPYYEVNDTGRIQIENLGSVNITEVWFNTSYPSQRPFGTGESSNYDSANFIALDSNKSGVSDYNQFVNRLEYGIDESSGADTKDIIYLDTPSNWDYGRLRTANREYFWTIDDTGASVATFRIGVDAHNESQTGSTNLDNACAGGDEGSSNNDCNGYTNFQTSGDYIATDVEIGEVDNSNDALPGGDGGKIYCAVMNETQVLNSGADANPKVWFVKWNKNFGPAQSGDCGVATNYTIGGSSPNGELAPGDWITRNIRARVPYGVVSGELPQGRLWVLANSN